MRKVLSILALSAAFVGLAGTSEARWYQAQQARWVTRDPIGIEGGENLYSYVGNDPIQYVDYFGLKKVCVYRKMRLDYYWPGERPQNEPNAKRYEESPGGRLKQGSFACSRSTGVGCGQRAGYFPLGATVTLDPGTGSSISGTIMDYGTEGIPGYAIERWMPWTTAKPPKGGHPGKANALVCWDDSKGNCKRPKDAFDFDPNKPLPPPTERP